MLCSIDFGASLVVASLREVCIVLACISDRVDTVVQELVTHRIRLLGLACSNNVNYSVVISSNFSLRLK